MRALWFRERTRRWSRRGTPQGGLGQPETAYDSSLVLPPTTLKLILIGSMILVGAIVAFWRVEGEEKPIYRKKVEVNVMRSTTLS